MQLAATMASVALMSGRSVWLGLLAAAVLAGCGSNARSTAPLAPVAGAGGAKPNVVFILTDDLSWDLVNPRFTPHIVALERRGETFDHYFVADSLCCPSRATIFTGEYPHDTGVLANVGRFGGYARFQERRLDQRTFAVALQRRGYATSMLGKYLNGYGGPGMAKEASAVPPGWSDWHVSNRSGYRAFGYLLDDNGRTDRYAGLAGGCTAGGPLADIAAARRPADDYGVDRLGRDATAFIAHTRDRPFAVEVATFAPHRPYTPSPLNACDFPGLTAPRDPSFDAPNADPPAWLAGRAPLNGQRIGMVNTGFRRRAQSMEAVDALVARVEAQLQTEHLGDRTYI